ncbi:hypothetical protein [Chrysiogenes arsenatis]|uniref:hypothetical protein n=1 Tax=Chrysiogenes arsenatis TaxID=309797 RepID=UPI000410FC1A|nr:hypothetical protein [Chrysiogenes arsenatis]
MSAAILLATYLPISPRAAHLLIEEIKDEIKKELEEAANDGGIQAEITTLSAGSGGKAQHVG